MNKFVYILTIILVSSCVKTKEQIQFDWLLGAWERTNNSKGTKTYEYWTKHSGIEYVGFGCTLKDNDTLFKENIRLIKLKDTWNFEVIGVNEMPTLFQLTTKTATSFSCENKQNEFPKKISYAIDGKHLKAIISDDNTEIPFVFIKK